MNRRYQTTLACVLLSAMVLALFYPVTGHDFLNMDDPFFITGHHVPDGLTWGNIKRAFTLHYGMWMPLTWLSHMTDVQFYGLRPAGHHLTNLFIHLANTLLLFLLLRSMTGAFYKSFIVAAIFALHPLNVEPVAYISCRKGLLAGFFWLLTILAYTRYAHRRSIKRYLLVCLCFLLGMMAKPVLVVLPLIFLLLDYWPLNRFHSEKTDALIKEKLPLLVVSAIIGLVTILTQQQAEALSTLSAIPVSGRVANVLVNYMTYLGRVFWPSGLAIFYPWPHHLPLWKPIVAGALLVILTTHSISDRQHSPYVFSGWFWFVIALLPVIGLIPVGSHTMADRYAYLPCIGIFIAIVWVIAAFAEEWRLKKAYIALSVLAILLLLGFLSRRQLGFWQNNGTVFRHALEVTTDNYAAHNNLARALIEEEKLKEARVHLNEALKINPTFPQAHNNLGVLLAAEKKTGPALMQFSQAIQYRPDFAEAYYNMANELLVSGDSAAALAHYRKVFDIDPDYPHAADIHYHVGLIMTAHHKTKQAALDFQQALSLDSGHIEAADKLAEIYKTEKQYDKAIVLYERLLQDRPDCSISITYNLACLFALKNEPVKAIAWLKESIVAGFSQYEFLMVDKELNNIRQTKDFQALKDQVREIRGTPPH